MTGLLRKVFHRSEPEEVEGYFPPLPDYLNLHTFQKKAITGILARDLALESTKDKHIADSLFYKCLFDEQTHEHREFLDPTSALLEWIEDGQDIEKKIHEANLSEDIKKRLFSIFNRHKKDLNDLFLKDVQQASNDKSFSNEGTNELVEKWKIYRDVIYASTQKQFLLISEEEIPQYKKGEILLEEKVVQREDIPRCRDMAKEALKSVGVPASSVMSWLLVISEAVTNILKHADYGKVTITHQPKTMHVIVEDTGPGFDLEGLPNMTLMSGYSTKQSLGQGFTLMMKMAKQILLSTSSKGSTLILVFENG